MMSSTTSYHTMLKSLIAQCVGSFIEVDNNCVDSVRYSPLVYSYDLQSFNCTDSHYNWVKYVIAVFVPLY